MHNKKLWIILLSVSAILLTTAAGYFYSRRQTAMLLCQDHLRQIDLALQQYAHVHGIYPASLELLIQDKSLSADQASCPLGDGYVYCAGGRKPSEIEPQAIIIFDKPSNHPGEGNVLYGDGMVQRVTGKRLEGLNKIWRYTPPLESVIRVTKPATTRATER